MKMIAYIIQPLRRRTPQHDTRCVEEVNPSTASRRTLITFKIRPMSNP